MGVSSFPDIVIDPSPLGGYIPSPCPGLEVSGMQAYAQTIIGPNTLTGYLFEYRLQAMNEEATPQLHVLGTGSNLSAQGFIQSPRP